MRRPLLFACFAIVSLYAALPAAAQTLAANGAASPAAASPARIWLNPDGQPLPFANDDQVLDFLRTATVVSKKPLGAGTTLVKKVLLEKDGVRAHAVFRDVDEEKQMAAMANGLTEMYFRDSYIMECAAYELSRLLGLNNVPPVVLRKIDGVDGSLQIWVEHAVTEAEKRRRKMTPPDVMRWSHQVYTVRIFDNLIYNTDRNLGNTLIDEQWNLWMIDHTRAFRRQSDLRLPKEIMQCERGLLQKLRAMNEDVVRERMKPFLRKFEIDSLLKRRDKLVAHLEKMIAERGAEKVLF